MNKLIAIAAVAAVVFATPAMAGGFGHHRGGNSGYGGNSAPLVNVDASGLDVLTNAQFLNGIYAGNNSSVLSGILSGNSIANGNSTPVLNGNSIPVLTGITSGLGLGILNSKKRGRRW